MGDSSDDTSVTGSQHKGDSVLDDGATRCRNMGEGRRVAGTWVTKDWCRKQSTSGTWVTPRPQARRMTWKTTCPMDERVKFIAAYLRGELAVSRLCDAFGVSRKTAYKWIARYSEGGVAELVERSRRPHAHPNAMSPKVESLIIATRKEHAFWGPKKLLAVLRGSYPGLKLPATSTVGHLLARRGLSHPRRSPRRSSPYG